MRRTLDTVTGQTAPPDLWVIVDDGSTDRTPEILADYAKLHSYIQVVRREDRGSRSVGPGVIEAFYAGLATVDLAGWDYLCKLDMDLQLPPRYFEILLDRMEEDPRLEIVPVEEANGTPTAEQQRVREAWLQSPKP